MLINQLGLAIAPQQDRKIIEPSDNALKFDAFYQKDSDRRLGFAKQVQKSVLQIRRLALLRSFLRFGARSRGKSAFASYSGLLFLLADNV